MTLLTAPAIAETDYDGVWNVTVITRIDQRKIMP
jgi:hypothetical protein